MSAGPSCKSDFGNACNMPSLQMITYHILMVVNLTFKELAQHLGLEAFDTLEDAAFHKYDAGGKGHLTAAEVTP